MCFARNFSTQTPNAVDLSTKCHPGKSVSGRRELKYVQILSQNTQGLNTDKEEMILDVMKQKNILPTQFKKLGELEAKSPRNMAITSSSMARNPNPTEKAVCLVVLPSSSVPPLFGLGSQQDRV